jgi:PAS domain S-box-containing protein
MKNDKKPEDANPDLEAEDLLKNSELILSGEKLKQMLEEQDLSRLALLSILEDEKNSRQNLIESEERYRTFINATDDIAYLKDDQFRYIVTNKNHMALLNKSEDEIIGKTDFEILPEITALQCSESDKLAITGNGTVVTEETFNDRIYETRKFPVKLKNDKTGIGCFIRDVTVIRTAAKSIEKAAQEWRITFDSIEDAIWLLDPDFNILRSNAASEKMLGICLSELIGKKCWSVVHGTDVPVEECPVLKLKKSSKPESSVLQIKGRWLNITVYPIFGENSELTGIVHIISDITEQKILENKLILQSTAIKNAANGIIITDTDGDILWTNPAFESLTGYSGDEIIGHNPRDLIKSGKHDAEFYRKIWLTITSGNTWRGEITNRRKDGSLYTEEMTIAPVKNSKEEIVNFIAIKQDITDKKFADDLLNIRFELINYSVNHSLEEIMVKALDEIEKFTSSSIGFFHFLEDDQNTLSLQAWSTQTSLKFCKTEGRGMHYNIADAGVWVDCIRERKALIHNDYMSLHHRRGLPVGHAEVVREMVIPLMRDDKINSIIGLGNKITDYTDNDVSVTSYIANIVWDIVEKKRAEENLIKQNADLEVKVANRTAELAKMNKELESFSYSVSHDLRAPLRHITGFIELLKIETGGILNEKARHQIEVIDESAKRMHQLIEDLLSYSRMGRADFSNQNVDMNALAADVLNEYSRELISRKISPDVHPLPEVKGDRAMIRVVYVNLISNAIKFSNKTVNPQIEIGVKIIEGENTFFVKDNGAGFNMKYADKLFGVFQRLHSSRDFEGTGIGLAMVKNIIERHNGRIWAESEPGKGTCFYFTIPVLPHIINSHCS